MTPTFRVWAPRAQSSVDVVIGGARRPMVKAERGWWEAHVPGARAGTRYGFSLDGGPVRPDPRSASQPEGIDAPSELVDHHAFAWTDSDWTGVELASAVLYELHIGTFTPEGTFDAATTKLGHLRELGVDVVELLPVVEFSGSRGWGYDGVDLYAPHSAYGGPDGLKRFVDAAHRAGIAVVLDVVYNHLGPAGNYLAEFGPYFTDRYSTPWGMAVNVDGPGSDEVRSFIVDNVRMWLRDYHVDGLRLDAVHAIFDSSAVHLLEELASAVHEFDHRFVIAETDLNDPRLVARRDVGGYELDAQWNDDFHHCLHTLLTGERAGYYESFGSVEQLATAYRRGFVFAGEFDPHRGRRHGRPPEGIPAWRFLGYLQNHDQIGNRAQGDRSSHLLTVEQLHLAAALVLTSPFVPMLFQGEEWGASTPFQYFTDHHDAELGRAVSEGRRSEFSYFGWAPDEVPDPQDAGTFERSKLRWEELGATPHRALLEWYRRLIALRRQHPALGPGRFEDLTVRFSEADRWIVIERRAGDDIATIVANLSGDKIAVPFDAGERKVLAAAPAPLAVGRDAVELDGWGVAVLG